MKMLLIEIVIKKSDVLHMLNQLSTTAQLCHNNYIKSTN